MRRTQIVNTLGEGWGVVCLFVWWAGALVAEGGKGSEEEGGDGYFFTRVISTAAVWGDEVESFFRYRTWPLQHFGRYGGFRIAGLKLSFRRLLCLRFIIYPLGYSGQQIRQTTKASRNRSWFTYLLCFTLYAVFSVSSYYHLAFNNPSLSPVSTGFVPARSSTYCSALTLLYLRLVSLHASC